MSKKYSSFFLFLSFFQFLSNSSWEKIRRNVKEKISFYFLSNCCCHFRFLHLFLNLENWLEKKVYCKETDLLCLFIFLFSLNDQALFSYISHQILNCKRNSLSFLLKSLSALSQFFWGTKINCSIDRLSNHSSEKIIN